MVKTAMLEQIICSSIESASDIIIYNLLFSAFWDSDAVCKNCL